MASVAQPAKNLGDLVENLINQRKADLATSNVPQPPKSPPIPKSSDAAVAATGVRRSHDDGKQQRRQSVPPPSTPSGRTGPPRSIKGAPSSRFSAGEPGKAQENFIQEEDEYPFYTSSPDAEESHFRIPSTPFRGAFEYNGPEKEKERERAERRAKRRDSSSQEGSFPHPARDFLKRLAETPRGSPILGGSPAPSGLRRVEEQAENKEGKKKEEDGNPWANLRRARSTPSTPTHGEPRSATSQQRPGTATTPRWGRLRSLLPVIASQHRAALQASSTVVPHSVNITDELITGGLSTLILRLWVERDEKDQRAVPMLFHHLRIRVSDSLHPTHGHKAVFRIECEYANGAVRWVVYRQLREFLSLHTHYTLSNAYNRNVEGLPEFPKTSLPYFKFLKDRGQDVGRADFARLQREALENYLIGLIRAVMFHPAANRLAGFLEISALMVALAQSGGAQYKAGFLRLDAVSNKSNLGRRGTSWRERKAQKWCSVRESYLVIHEEIGELAVWDVFLIDSDFRIERPTRYYRQGLNLFHQFEVDQAEEVTGSGPSKDLTNHDEQQDHHNLGISSVRGTLSRIFRVPHLQHRRKGSTQTEGGQLVNGEAHHANGDGHARSSDSDRGSTFSSAFSSERALTPMLDPSTNTNPLLAPEDEEHDPAKQGQDSKKKKGKAKAKDVSKHTFYIENSQMRLKLFARNERQMLQWIAALERVAKESHYTGKNRFDSFAPIRLNVAAQWLVDGRDYFWNLSRAILLAKETIYIHDWWLSPELEMRRPEKPKYRLDHLLERKAKEGVKVCVIVYQEVSSRTTPIDSSYTKQRLVNLHPNIMVQRSPSHFQTGTFYWAHHEKLCVIDQAIAFMGGVDLCYGRWDTPQHVLADDPDEGPQIWPGKDYSNPRIQDFHTLNKPEDDMYDRSKIPRMPWHDVGMQVVGQPARDLSRHFVQRWNYLLRIKNHTREMPFLLPPPEFRPGELQQLGLTGTCELQICRSAGPWSLGTPDRIEHSIQNAYLKAIQLSEHFVYIENQFFITSTIVNEVKVENKIGDALVHRIIRAHKEGTPWKCCILIPLIPGFTYPVDHSDASAIRIIMECQNRTICRGPHSIFGRLRKEGIDPDEYITVFSLRNWAKLKGGSLTTEEVYIHGKVCIVDDRLAIIGSANINERSQRGDRDSEIAAIIRDTDMIDSMMAGKSYKVGRFAHTLRVRLMREHIGVDVDSMYEEDLMASEPVAPAYEQHEWDPESEQQHGKESGVTRVGKRERHGAVRNLMKDTIDGVEQVIHGSGDAGYKDIAVALRMTGIKSKGLDNTAGDKFLQEERQMYTRDGKKEPGFPSSVVPTIEEKVVAEDRPPKDQAVGSPIKEQLQDVDAQEGQAKDHVPDLPQAQLQDGELFGAPANAFPDPAHDDEPPHAKTGSDDADNDERKAIDARETLRKHQGAKLGTKPWTLPTPTPQVDPHGFDDPICDGFWKNVWLACAVHNTEIYRKVFHAVPDDLITTWKQYREFVVHHERLNQPVKEAEAPQPVARLPSESADQDGLVRPRTCENTVHVKDENSVEEHADRPNGQDGLPDAPSPPAQDTRGKKGTKGIEPFDRADQEEMERLLEQLRGHLVLYPTRFLEGEDAANNFLFNADRLLPLPIYD